MGKAPPASNRKRKAWHNAHKHASMKQSIDTLNFFPELWPMIDRRMRELEWVRWEMLVCYMCIMVPGEGTVTGIGVRAVEEAEKEGLLETTEHKYLKSGDTHLYAKFSDEGAIAETIQLMAVYDADRRLRGDESNDFFKGLGH